MTYTTFLARIRALFGPHDGDHLDQIVEGFSRGTLTAPGRPMTDQELARAIREFQSFPVSERSMRKLARRFEDSVKPKR